MENWTGVIGYSRRNDKDLIRSVWGPKPVNETDKGDGPYEKGVDRRTSWEGGGSDESREEEVFLRDQVTRLIGECDGMTRRNGRKWNGKKKSVVNSERFYDKLNKWMIQRTNGQRGVILRLSSCPSKQTNQDFMDLITDGVFIDELITYNLPN